MSDKPAEEKKEAAGAESFSGIMQTAARVNMESKPVFGPLTQEGDDATTLEAKGVTAQEACVTESELESRLLSVYSLLVGLPAAQAREDMKNKEKAKAGKPEGINATTARNMIEWTLPMQSEGIKIPPPASFVADAWDKLREDESYPLTFKWLKEEKAPLRSSAVTHDVSIRFPPTTHTRTWSDMVSSAKAEDGHVLFSIPITWEFLCRHGMMDPEMKAWLAERGSAGQTPSPLLVTDISVSHVKLKNVPRPLGVTVGHIVSTDSEGGRAIAEFNIAPIDMKRHRTDQDARDNRTGFILDDGSCDKPVSIWNARAAGMSEPWTYALGYPLSEARKALSEARFVTAKDTATNEELTDNAIVKLQAPIMGTKAGRESLTPLQFALVRAHPYILRWTQDAQDADTNGVWQHHRKTYLKFPKNDPNSAEYFAHKEATSSVLDGIARASGRNFLIDQRRGLVLQFRMPGGAAAVAIEKLRLQSPTGEMDADVIPEISFQLCITGKRPAIDIPIPSIHDTVKGQTVIPLPADVSFRAGGQAKKGRFFTTKEAMSAAPRSMVDVGTTGRSRALRGRMDSPQSGRY